MKKIKLTLEGGFHNVNPINVQISASDYECLRDGEASLTDVLSETQLARMNLISVAWKGACVAA